MNKKIKNIKNHLSHDTYKLEACKNNLLNLKNNHKTQVNNFNIFGITYDVLSDNFLEIVVKLKMIKIIIKNLLQIIPKKILYLNKLQHDTLNIFLNNILIAQMKLVQLKDKYGTRIFQIIKSDY